MNVRCKATLCGIPTEDVEYEDGVFIAKAAELVQKDFPDMPVVTVLQTARARLAAAKAAQAEREKRISDALVKSNLGPETPAERKERNQHEIAPIDMTDEQYLRYMLDELKTKHPEYPTAQLLREARMAMLKTKAERARIRKETAEALARKAAQERGELPPVPIMPGFNVPAAK